MTSIDEVLAAALVEKLTPIDWPEGEDVDPLAGSTGEGDRGDVVTH